MLNGHAVLKLKVGQPLFLSFCDKIKKKIRQLLLFHESFDYHTNLRDFRRTGIHNYGK